MSIVTDLSRIFSNIELGNCVDWVRLRVEHRIIGSFDGAEGEGWNSDIHMHFPVKLTDVETRYLVNHGIAKTVWNPSLEDPEALINEERVDRVLEQTRQEQVSFGQRDV